MSLEEGVRKITHNAAQILGIRDRGMLSKGMCADVTIFDPKTIDAIGNYAEPRQHPRGIEYVIVNGRLAVDKGKFTGELSGKVLHACQCDKPL
jgi:N-acyl-D-amino-acid deacylase